MSTRTDQAVDLGRRMLANPDAFLLRPDNQLDCDQLMDGVVASILTELAIARVSPAGLLPELVEKEDLSPDYILARRDHGQRLLAESPQLSALARQVRDHPDGQGIKAPRVPKPKRAQDEIVNMPISC